MVAHGGGYVTHTQRRFPAAIAVPSGVRILLRRRAKPPPMTVRFGDHRVSWLGYACARIAAPDGTVVYTDPGRYGTLDGSWAERYGGLAHPRGDALAPGDGDVIVVTHDHHYDSDGVHRVADDGATVLLYEAVDADRIRSGGRDVADPDDLDVTVERVGTGETHEIDGVSVDVLPAYNRLDGPNVSEDGTPFHPEGFGCGFHVTVGGASFLWPGDSDALDVHRERPVSVFLPPISSSFTMDRYDAADLAESIDPELVLPIHYNTFDDLSADSRAFAGDVASRGVPVALDERGWSG